METSLPVPGGSLIFWCTSSPASSSAEEFSAPRSGKRTGRHRHLFLAGFKGKLKVSRNALHKIMTKSPPWNDWLIIWVSHSDTSLFLNFLCSVDLASTSPHTNNFRLRPHPGLRQRQELLHQNPHISHLTVARPLPLHFCSLTSLWRSVPWACMLVQGLSVLSIKFKRTCLSTQQPST